MCTYVTARCFLYLIYPLYNKHLYNTRTTEWTNCVTFSCTTNYIDEKCIWGHIICGSQNTFSFSELSSSCLISFSLASLTACFVTDRMASCRHVYIYVSPQISNAGAASFNLFKFQLKAKRHVMCSVATINTKSGPPTRQRYLKPSISSILNPYGLSAQSVSASVIRRNKLIHFHYILTISPIYMFDTFSICIIKPVPVPFVQ